MTSHRFVAAGRSLLLALALAAVAGGTAAPAQQTGPISRAELDAMTVADLERGILSSQGGVTFAAVRRHYPDEYRVLLETMLARIRETDGSFAAGHLIGAQAMREFMARRAPELVNAPAALLNRINAGQLELIRGLGRDQVALCAEYATTGFTGRTPVPEPYLSQAATLSVLFIEASRAGADRPRKAGRGMLAEADAGAWYAALQRIGTPRDLLDALTRAGTSPPPSQDVNCRLGIAVYAAIQELPSEQAARVSAFFLQEGFRSQAPQ
jgi:hypothetical protein